MERGKTWTIEIDADILLRPEGILQLLQTASQRPGNSFFHFGMVFDKLTNSFRSAGNKILRTKHLPVAMELLPEIIDEVRPDTFIRKEMAKKGYHYYRDVCLIGIHDFEQHYFDLFRKGYLQGVKNRDKLEKFINNWPEGWQNDADYLALTGGMTLGKNHERMLPLNPEYYLDKFEVWKIASNFTKQKELLPSDLNHANSFITATLTDSKLLEFRQKCEKRKAQYHVRSDSNWYYRLMKLMYRMRLRFSKTKTHSDSLKTHES